MKKTVYLIQASAVYGESIKTAYLPYAAGCLMAYAFADEKIKKNYVPGRFIFTRENIDEAVASLDEPYLVGFSSYIWNMEYNKIFAKKIKEKYPGCIIAFGGHNVRPDGSDLEDIPEADIIMHGEGEETFKALLLAFLDDTPLTEVNNISFRSKNSIVTTERKLSDSIEDYPSPYLEGWFDDIIENSGISPSIVWETNRGCPNRCAFCDWGLLKSKVRQFPIERIKAEIDWMEKKKVEYVYCADANFGLFSRDTEIADMIIKSRREKGYPQVFKTNYTKNKDDVVFEISKKLIENGIGKSPTLSFQSLSPEVLNNIGRSNMELRHFRNLMAKYSEAKIPVYSELIIGLPGESYESFSDGVCTLLDCNQHTCIGIYPCELLPNSVMGAPDYRKVHHIETVKTGFSQYHIVPCDDDVKEHSNIVVSTSAMDIEDWKRSFIFSICVQAFHNLALTRAFAIYLHNEKNISYKSFYEKLIEQLKKEGTSTVAGTAYAKVSELTDGIVNGTNSFAYIYGDKEKITWSFEEYMFIHIASHRDEFYKELYSFIYDFGIDDEILEELIRYQSSVIKAPDISDFSFESNYDFYNYFKRVYTDSYAPLEKKKNRISTTNRPFSGLDEWARICVWYGRRDDAQLYTGKKNTITQEFI